MSIDRNLDHVLSPGGSGPERQDTDRAVDADPEEHEALEEATPPRDDDDDPADEDPLTRHSSLA
jgi:hypothetical protein